MKILSARKIANISTRSPKAATTLFLVLLLILSALFVGLQTVGAQTENDVTQQTTLYAFLNVAPNNIGVNQVLYLSFWLDKVPPTADVQYGDRWENLMIDITKPDGGKETLGPFTTDNIGGAYTIYNPDQIGTYKFKFQFPGQTIEGKNPRPDRGTNNAHTVGWYYKPADSDIVEITVNQEPLETRSPTPYPTDLYWTRPVSGLNPEWRYKVGDWLNVDPGANSFVATVTGPESVHVMWTEQIAFSGVAGGDFPDWNYYTGLAYETKFGTPIVMNGRAYYSLPFGTSGRGGGYRCVDMRTGELIWELDNVTMSFGQNYDYQSPNEFGIKAYLWTTGSTYDAYDPWTGRWLFSLVNATTGTVTFGPNGELLVYTLNGRNNWLTMWNSSKCIISHMSNIWEWRPQGRTMDWNAGIEWNVTVPEFNGPSPQAIHRIDVDSNVIIATTRASWAPRDYTQVIGYSAEDGSLLWSDNRTGPPGHIISWNTYQGSPAGEGVFVEFYPESKVFYGYNSTTGEQIWGPTEPLPDAFSIYTWQARIAYGKLFVPDFGGYVHAFDVHTGDKLWSYFLGEAGYDTPYGHYTIETPLIIADGKVYTSAGHAYSPPIFKGATLMALNESTGDLIWDISFYGDRMGMAVSDGYLMTYNIYDGQVYVFGKGPSAITIDAPMTAVQLGSSLVIRGQVTDECAGAQQLVAEDKFKSVPAISDEDQREWMEYLYMLQPKPADAKGVEVHLTAIDPNGNHQDIGTVTSDALGNYAIDWTPPVPGLYTVKATFEGSKSYARSEEGTAFVVSDAAVAPVVMPTQQTGGNAAPSQTTTTQIPSQSSAPSAAPTQAVQPPTSSGMPTTTYIAIGAAIVVIVVAVVALILRKRK
ncbi:MAG: PQQ-binding-like beta-propeller repeat protein [Candidatus Bathyarchaeota archaeon]|nr:PQQ-binding-like beta-propeller repeat protein [Candidatus Bathyarchaeota archaeon]